MGCIALLLYKHKEESSGVTVSNKPQYKILCPFDNDLGLMYLSPYLVVKQYGFSVLL